MDYCWVVFELGCWIWGGFDYGDLWLFVVKWIWLSFGNGLSD